MSRAADIEQRAAEWLMRRGEPDWSSTDQDALEQWLAESMENKAAFWRLDFGQRQISCSGANDVETPQPVSIIQRRWLARAMAAAASIAIVAGLGWTIWPSLRPPEPRALLAETVVGGRGQMSFSDGSRVELNTSSRARAAFGARNRDIWLDRGEAYFEVAHDRTRPFTVHAGNARVTVLGTKFSVRRDGNRVIVAVAEGRVRLENGEPSAAGSATLITAGDTAIMRGDAILLASRSADRVDNEQAWRHGMLRFDQETLANVAAEFNRYNHRQIVVADPEVAGLRIGGAFHARNVDTFVRLLQDAYGLHVERRGDEIKISN